MLHVQDELIKLQVYFGFILDMLYFFRYLTQIAGGMFSVIFTCSLNTCKVSRQSEFDFPHCKTVVGEYGAILASAVSSRYTRCTETIVLRHMITIAEHYMYIKIVGCIAYNGEKSLGSYHSSQVFATEFL